MKLFTAITIAIMMFLSASIGWSQDKPDMSAIQSQYLTLTGQIQTIQGRGQQIANDLQDYIDRYAKTKADLQAELDKLNKQRNDIAKQIQALQKAEKPKDIPKTE